MCSTLRPAEQALKQGGYCCFRKRRIQNNRPVHAFVTQRSQKCVGYLRRIQGASQRRGPEPGSIAMHQNRRRSCDGQRRQCLFAGSEAPDDGHRVIGADRMRKIMRDDLDWSGNEVMIHAARPLIH